MNYKTFEITSVGTKFLHANFKASSRSFKCRLYKNNIVANFGKGQVVHLWVEDKSITTDYGTDLLFNPIAQIENLTHYKEARNKWLPIALSDAKSGRKCTNAIKKTMKMIEIYPWLANDDFCMIAGVYVTERESTLIAEITTLLDKPCRYFLDSMKFGWRSEVYSELKLLSEKRIRPNREIEAVLRRAEDMTAKHKKGEVDFGQGEFKVDLSLIC